MPLKLIDHTENGARTTPEEVIQLALEDVRKHEYTRAIVLLVDHSVDADGEEEIRIIPFQGGVGINNVEVQGILALAMSQVCSWFQPKEAREK